MNRKIIKKQMTQLILALCLASQAVFAYADDVFIDIDLKGAQPAESRTGRGNPKILEVGAPACPNFKENKKRLCVGYKNDKDKVDISGNTGTWVTCDATVVNGVSTCPTDATNCNGKVSYAATQKERVDPEKLKSCVQASLNPDPNSTSVNSCEGYCQKSVCDRKALKDAGLQGDKPGVQEQCFTDVSVACKSKDDDHGNVLATKRKNNLYKNLAACGNDSSNPEGYNKCVTRCTSDSQINAQIVEIEKAIPGSAYQFKCDANCRISAKIAAANGCLAGHHGTQFGGLISAITGDPEKPEPSRIVPDPKDDQNKVPLGTQSEFHKAAESCGGRTSPSCYGRCAWSFCGGKKSGYSTSWSACLNTIAYECGVHNENPYINPYPSPVPAGR